MARAEFEFAIPFHALVSGAEGSTIDRKAVPVEYTCLHKALSGHEVDHTAVRNYLSLRFLKY
jgi:hypothetical protein